MGEMILYVVTVSLAIYGLSDIIQHMWSWLIKSNGRRNGVLLVALENGKAEFTIRNGTRLAKIYGVERIAAVDCGLDDETKTIAKMLANGEPMVEIYDENDRISKIVK